MHIIQHNIDTNTSLDFITSIIIFLIKNDSYIYNIPIN